MRTCAALVLIACFASVQPGEEVTFTLWDSPAKRRKLYSRADQICDGRLYQYAKEGGYWREITDQITWNEVWPDQWDTIRQNDLVWDLGRAYQTTGDEKYARKMNEVMYDWMVDNNSPHDGRQRIGGIWHAMHQAWRIGDAWSSSSARTTTSCSTAPPARNRTRSGSTSGSPRRRLRSTARRPRFTRTSRTDRTF